MGQGGSKQPSVSEAELTKTARKCAYYASGLEACRKANAGDALRICKNLEVKLVSCYAEEYAVEEAAENRRCYTKLYTTGMYKGLGHCIPYEDAMRACLKARGCLYISIGRTGAPYGLRSGALPEDDLWLSQASGSDCDTERDPAMRQQDYATLLSASSRPRPSERAIIVCHCLPSMWTRPVLEWATCAPCPPRAPYRPAYAIGRAMAETDSYHPKFVESCNMMDAVWVPSAFSARVLESSGVHARLLRVVPEPIDIRVFDPARDPTSSRARGGGGSAGWPRGARVTGSPKPVPWGEVMESLWRRDMGRRHGGSRHGVGGGGGRGTYRFLSCGKWEQRKGWDVLLDAFLTEFSHAGDDVELLILSKAPEGAASAGGSSDDDGDDDGVDSSTAWVAQQVLAHVAQRMPGADVTRLPRVYVEASRLSEPDLVSLYHSADAFVLPTRGEGWGLPVAEAMAMGLPAIVTGWSGVADLVTEEVGYHVRWSLSDVAEGKDGAWWLVGKWADADVGHLREVMRHVYDHPEEAAAKGAAARTRVVEKFSPALVAALVAAELAAVGRLLNASGVTRAHPQVPPSPPRRPHMPRRPLPAPDAAVP
ncbi:hypothetical protein FOA52_003089 [Chlamydomonas sp. UWO 241]|nr:hypothetical protein FOA52_003089 [Chlamydomonas sp. UWO 241]